MTIEPQAPVRAALPVYLESREVPMKLTLCGSTKFRAEYELWNKRLTLAGFLVYSVSGFGHSGDDFTEEEKVQLDRVHLAKIDACHAIVVINPGGYIGKSTAREIAHAEAANKPVYYLSHGRTVFQLRTGPGGSASMRYRAFDYAAALSALSAHPQAKPIGREELARMIDPEAWRVADELSAMADHWEAFKREDILSNAAGMREAAAKRTAPSLAIADAIRSRITGERGAGK